MEGNAVNDDPGADAGREHQKRWSLRVLLVLLVVIAVASAIAPVSYYFITKQQDGARRALAERSMAVREDLRTRGIEIAQSVARSSERALATMDFLFLAEIVDTTVGADQDIAYGIIMDQNGRALVHSDKTRANAVLRGPADAFALEQTKPATHEVAQGDVIVLEAVAPIQVEDKRWGVVRFGLSLDRLNREVAAAQQQARQEMRTAVRNSVLAAGLLAILGALLGAMFAGRIATPINRLVQGVRSVREGNLDQSVEVGGSREVAELAMAYNEMTGRLSALLADMADKASIERELAVARSVQQNMIPSATVHRVGEFSLVGHCEMAENCGGDWWGFHELENGRLLLVIGDATGHGLPAAIIAATARGALQAAAAVDPAISPRAALEAIDKAIQDAAGDKLLMTACAVAIEADGVNVEFANAGHVLPLTYATAEGNVVDIGVLAARGNPLGSHNVIIGEIRHELPPGAVLLLMTDGLRERFNEAGAMYGDRRLYRLLRQRAAGHDDADLKALRDEILESVRSFAAGKAADDDLTVVLCRAPQTITRRRQPADSVPPKDADGRQIELN